MGREKPIAVKCKVWYNRTMTQNPPELRNSKYYKLLIKELKLCQTRLDNLDKGKGRWKDSSKEQVFWMSRRQTLNELKEKFKSISSSA